MKIFNAMKLKKVSEEDIDFLYDMLKERDPIENILHKKIPTYDEYVKFVTKSHPYDGWYIIMLDSQKLGHINIIHKENYYVGWFIKKEFQNLGIAIKAFEMLKKLHKSSIYTGKSNPKNIRSHKFMEKLGFKLTNKFPDHLVFELDNSANTNKIYTKNELRKSFSLFNEAKKFHPGGVSGINRPYNFVENEYPIFFQKGKGGKVMDVDGNEYIDMLCSYGPIVIGHREEEIDDAVIHQIKNFGFNFSLTQPIHNTLLKKITEIIPCAEQTILVKTGSDATTTAIRAARAFTNKNKIIRCGYLGWHDWCIDVKGGIPENAYKDIIDFNYNDFEGLKKIIEENENEVAAVILWPIHAPPGNNVEFPKDNFLHKIRELTSKKNIILIFDEMRSGFRVDLGGAQKKYNVTPDLATFGKAMANGYSIAALTGKREILEVYSKKAFISGTYFGNSLSMAAALKTIEFIETNDVITDLNQKGEYFKKKMDDLIQNYNNFCEFSGSPWMPYLTFRRDKNEIYKKNREIFFTEMIRQKVFWQPYHHSYFCYRHTYDDIDYVLTCVENSLKKILVKNDV